MTYTRWMLFAVVCLWAALALTGCATGLGVAGMTPEQLMQFGKIKDVTATCVRGMYAGVTVVATFVNADKGIPSGVTIKETCEVVFSAPPKTP